MTPGWLVHLHAGATLYMAGLIWFVQLVHYPLMRRVGREGYDVYQAQHARRTAWAVGPAMLTELACAVWLVALPPAELGRGLPLAGLVLLAVIWLSTARLQVPCHRKLAHGFDPAVHRRLVLGNWLRTAAWSARGVIALAMI